MPLQDGVEAETRVAELCASAKHPERCVAYSHDSDMIGLIDGFYLLLKQYTKGSKYERSVPLFLCRLSN